MTGQVFGELTIDGMVYDYNGKKGTYCSCTCSCGNHKIIRASNIRRGATKSCGHLEKESRYGRNHSKLHEGDRFGNLTLVKDSGKRMPNCTIVWECKCDCGNIIYVPSYYLIKGWWTSCGCSDDVTRHHRWNLKDVRFGRLVAIEKDAKKKEEKNKTYWICKCDCGNICSVPQSNLLNGWSTSCGCARANGATAKYIGELLKQNGISYIPEYRFDDCRDKQALPFDYYLPDLNIAIEYDGIQHFKPVDLFGGEQAFLILQKHDEIKTDYCKEHNIELIRIPYTTTDEEIIEIINNLRTRNE